MNAIGVDWTNRNDRKWQQAYDAAVEYRKTHGDLNVPSEYVTADGLLLGKWIASPAVCLPATRPEQHPPDPRAEGSVGRAGHGLEPEQRLGLPPFVGAGIQAGASRRTRTQPVYHRGGDLAGQLDLPPEAAVRKTTPP